MEEDLRRREEAEARLRAQFRGQKSRAFSDRALLSFHQRMQKICQTLDERKGIPRHNLWMPEPAPLPRCGVLQSIDRLRSLWRLPASASLQESARARFTCPLLSVWMNIWVQFNRGFICSYYSARQSRCHGGRDASCCSSRQRTNTTADTAGGTCRDGGALVVGCKIHLEPFVNSICIFVLSTVKKIFIWLSRHHCWD